MMTSSWLLSSFQSDEAGGAEREAEKTRRGEEEREGKETCEIMALRVWRNNDAMGPFTLVAFTASEDTLTYEQHWCGGVVSWECADET